MKKEASMQKNLFGQSRPRDQELTDRAEKLFKDIKWRRRGTDRRCMTEMHPNRGDFVEKRTCADRRHDYMSLVSHIIFPKGWAKN